MIAMAGFVLAAGVVWYAGIRLSDAVDVLAERLGLGQAMAGMILLAIATNLPEIAITVSAALRGDLGLAIGNILGGIAIQTAVLALCDACGPQTGAGPLTRRAADLGLILEGVLVIAVLTVAIMATQLPKGLTVGRLAPGDAGIVVLWGVGLWLLSRARRGLPWPEHGDASRLGRKRERKGRPPMSLTKAWILFAIAATATLVAGVGLELTGEAIAADFGMTGVLFGATFLAAATALPEVSTGIRAVRLGDDQMAVSDIFGGNAFLPTLFLPASLISGGSALPQARASDIYLAGLGILVTTVYLTGLVFRPKRRLFRMGVDSVVVVVLYLVGVAGLAAIPDA